MALLPTDLFTPSVRMTQRWLVVRTYVPTLLTMTRLLCPVYFFPLLQAGHTFMFTVAAILAAVTDWLDGQLARKWKCTTDGGAKLDIYADKVFCATLMGVGLTNREAQLLYVVPIVILVTYHVVVILMRVVGTLPFEASKVAKMKMFVEMLGLVLAFSFFDTFGLAWLNGVGLVIVWVAAGLAIWSGLHYKYKGFVPDWPEKFWLRKA